MENDSNICKEGARREREMRREEEKKPWTSQNIISPMPSSSSFL